VVWVYISARIGGGGGGGGWGRSQGGVGGGGGGGGTSGPRAPVLCSADKAHSYCAPRQQSARTYLYYNTILYVRTYT